MRTKCETVYTAAELKALEENDEHEGRPFTYALEKYREHLDLEYTSEELMSSLKGLCDAAGVHIKDYNLGAYNRGNNLSVSMSEEAESLTGARALAWIENNILGPLRAPWGLTPVAKTSKQYRQGTHNTKYNTDENGRPIRRWTAPGCVKECPFTGISFDMDFLEDLIKSVRAGRTLKEAFEDLAYVFARILEDEYRYQQTEEQFLESADANGWEFDESGRVV